jgi:hypothetical protein
MRTTLTLDPDVARLVEEAVHRERRSMKQVINDALRQALGPSASSTPRKPYRLTPHESSLRPGLGYTGFNRLTDELEDEAIVSKLRRSS